MDPTTQPLRGLTFGLRGSGFVPISTHVRAARPCLKPIFQTGPDWRRLRGYFGGVITWPCPTLMGAPHVLQTCSSRTPVEKYFSATASHSGQTA